ncbi:MAG TPA: hypothetical protein VK250_05245 [Nitrososphaeraceae archaeon]|nr:hypothetical protein [Nitrososphaeraceae archaeon]
MSKGNKENIDNFDIQRYIDNISLIIIDSNKTFSNLNLDDKTTIVFLDNSNPHKDKILPKNKDNNFTSLVRMSF